MIFDQVRRPPFPIGVDDYLNVAEVRNRIERCMDETVDTGSDREDREDKNEKLIPRTRFDDALDERLSLGHRRFCG